MAMRIRRPQRVVGPDRSAPKPCAVLLRPHGPKCGISNWGWTNFMEPLCLDHFRQRKFLQEWMQMQQGMSWAALIKRGNPQGWMDFEETEESKKRRNLKHIREVQDTLRNAHEVQQKDT